MEEAEGKERKTFVQERAEDFAVRIVNLWKYLLKHQEYDMSRQVKRSSTSIGANITEAIFAASKRDFLNKMYIAYKECGETKYWLRILHKTEFITQEEFDSLYNDATEIDKMLTSIIRTTKANLATQ